jgi:hypothetical protein
MNILCDASSFRLFTFTVLGCVAHVRYNRDEARWPARLRELMGSPVWREASTQPPSIAITVIRSTRDAYWRVRQHGQPAQKPFVWRHEDALVQSFEWRLYATSAAESPA